MLERPRRKWRSPHSADLIWKFVQKFHRTATTLIHKSGEEPREYTPSDSWVGYFKNHLSKKNEEHVVRELAYFVAWLKSPKGERRDHAALRAAGEANYLDACRKFYQRNVRLIAEIYLELS